MRRSSLLVVLFVLLVCSSRLAAWGERGHQAVNRAAVRAIPDDGPTFLHAHEEWISYLAIIPDSWRRPSEPFLKIVEDPNHGWFREQFAFMKEVPRSRYEFVLALDAEHRRLMAAGDTKAAALTNVRWTGTLPYAAVESYERMVAGMRRYRAAHAKGGGAETRFIELEIASYFGRLGHYIADGAQPLHDSIHHDGWQGSNPKGYTTDPRVHGRFESQFVDLIDLTANDIQADVPPAVVLPDAFDAVLAHLDDAATHVEEVYRLDKSGALVDAANAQARALVRRQLSRAAALLRDLAYTAWVRSGETITPGSGPAANPTLETHPSTIRPPDPRPRLAGRASSRRVSRRRGPADPRTRRAQEMPRPMASWIRVGAAVAAIVTSAASSLRSLEQSTAPAPAAVAGPVAVSAATSAAASAPGVDGRRFQPLVWKDPVLGRNFPWFVMLEGDAAARKAVAGAPALQAMFEAKRKQLSEVARTCTEDLACHATALAWSSDDITRVREALVTITRGGAMRSVIEQMRRSGLFERDAALDDAALVARTWERTAAGVNNILAVYGRGEKPRYPAIDAVSHDVSSPYYVHLVHTMAVFINEDASRWELFYQPTLTFALQLLEINWRDEAGRLEPLHLGENAAAYKRIATIKWADYPYTVALVPGAGLTDAMDREDHPLNPLGKIISGIAARRYHDKKVPFIIVSGGYVHPKHTRFAEAVEMKRALMRDFGVPEDAILIDPHARHTTTNVRNAARLMFRYGIPTDRPALITTQQYHLDSIAAATFGERCDRELGYRPYELKRRLSPFELEWLPRAESLHADPLDPLDP